MLIRALYSAGAVCLMLLVVPWMRVYALTVEPSIFDFSVSPGEQTRLKLAITNSQNDTNTIRIDIADLTYSPEGLPQFTTAGAAPDSLISWIVAEKSVKTAAAGKVLTVPFDVRVPERAVPGGHYGAILVSTEADVTAGNPADIGVVPKVAALLYIDVNGAVKREFAVSSFATTRRFFASFPITFSLSLRNTGTVHLQPHGVVTITHVWTNAPRGTVIVNEDSAYILPKKERAFSLVWEEASPNLFDPRCWGPYRAEVQLAATGATRKTARISFWIMPIWYMLIEVGGALCFLVLAIKFVRKISGYGK